MNCPCFWFQEKKHSCDIKTVQDSITGNVFYFGLDTVVDCFQKSLQLYHTPEQIKQGNHLPVISVGAGCAALEKYVEWKLGITITCVDPDPESYAEGRPIFIKPLYPTVQNLIYRTSAYTNNCILFICNALGTGYDYDAVKLLKPKVVIAIYDPISCISGSDCFNEWVHENKNKIYFQKTVHITGTYIHYDKKEKPETREDYDTLVVIVNDASKKTSQTMEQVHMKRLYKEQCWYDTISKEYYYSWKEVNSKE
jgi:hypothetical protein